MRDDSLNLWLLLLLGNGSNPPPPPRNKSPLFLQGRIKSSRYNPPPRTNPLFFPIILIMCLTCFFLNQNWPLSESAPLVADPCRSVYIAHKMASDGVENTPSAAILWAIYTDLHGIATIGALLESGQFVINKSF